MKKIISLLFLITIVFSVQSQNTSRDTIFIQSLTKLAKYARKSNVIVKMKPGEYTLNSTKISQHSIFKRAKNSAKKGDFRIGSLIHFSGNNSSYFLSGVIILIDSKLHRNFGNSEFSEVFLHS